MTTVIQESSPTKPRPSLLDGGGRDLSVDEAASALRVLRHGVVDESTSRFLLPPAVRATVSPVIAALRWATVMFGVVFAAPDANNGDLAVVVSLAIALFHTTWRTFRPLRLADRQFRYQALAIADGVILGLAVGISGGFDSPFVLCLLAVTAVAAFGWGIRLGLATLGATIVGMTITGLSTNAGLNLGAQSSFTVLLTILIIIGLLAFGRIRLLEAERRRANLAGRIDTLSETNDLLHILNQVARTLPTSLDLREALAAARDQLTDAFDATVVALVVVDESGEHWTPQLSDGCSLAPSASRDELHPYLQQVLDSDSSLLVPDFDGGLAPASRTGVYTALRTRGKTVGLLAVEHESPGMYSSRELHLVDGLAEVLALTVDNARWFRRLRTLGAEEERSRIARDLHDRLGQWLTYISFELERIMQDDAKSAPELDHLYGDVQMAIDELRETLRQLRAGVTAEKPLTVVARDHLDRFGSRGKTKTVFTVVSPGASMSLAVENELLRIIQEALNNIEKHAMASSVEVIWDVRDDGADLTIRDDGRGFDLARSVRESAYGLVGMRERADSVGATIDVSSSPGRGTEITVHVPREARGAIA